MNVLDSSGVPGNVFLAEGKSYAAPAVRLKHSHPGAEKAMRSAQFLRHLPW